MFPTARPWFQLPVDRDIFACMHISTYFIVSAGFVIIFSLFFFDLIVVLFLI